MEYVSRENSGSCTRTSIHNTSVCDTYKGSIRVKWVISLSLSSGAARGSRRAPHKWVHPAQGYISSFHKTLEYMFLDPQRPQCFGLCGSQFQYFDLKKQYFDLKKSKDPQDPRFFAKFPTRIFLKQKQQTFFLQNFSNAKLFFCLDPVDPWILKNVLKKY